jgi:serine/threonine-protein kinase
MSVSPPTPSLTIIAERYELQRRLAQGGMAEVWLAVDLTLDRKVAVKWLKPMLASDEVVAERFRREAIAAASLNHPNIVAVHDVFEHDGRQAVVMQLVDGKSLRQLLDTQKRLSPELTGHIGACVAAALDNAHQNNFVHRDVKPGNIMITPDGRVLLTDFGIAKALAGGDDLTSENIMMGTAKYLSPEQVRGKKLDGRADLYSLGLVLYECLAGRVPFLGETDADTALARLQRDPTDLSRLRATLPTGLVTVIHQLLARNPEHRPATGAELVRVLEAAAKEAPPRVDDTPQERSTVAPFSAGRLRRAPSDVDGRADDRRRATRADSPVHGTGRARGRRSSSDRTPAPASRPAPVNAEAVADTVASPTTNRQQAATTMGPLPPRRRIPGEPVAITGAVPVQRVSPAPTPEKDHTPAAGAGLRGRPAKGMSQGWRPSITVVGGLLVLAAVVALVLWMSVQFGGDDPSAPTTVLPPEAAGQADAGDASVGAPAGDVASGDIVAGDPAASETDAALVAAATPAGPVSIIRISAYDPDGDGVENDDEASRAGADGDDSTVWRTVCYGGEYMGGKRGVGLVASLDGLGQRALQVDVVNGPYIVEFFASAADEIPPTIDDWGTPLGKRLDGLTGEVVTSPVPATPVRHMLVLVEQIGLDPSCSDANPYRGRLGEIALVG